MNQTLPTLLFALLLGCSTSASTPGTSIPATYLDTSAADAGDSDSAGVTDATQDTGSASHDIGSTAVDGVTQHELDTHAVDDDTGSVSADIEEEIVTELGGGMMFAHTKDALYTLDMQKQAMTKVGVFVFDKKKGLVTDIALDQFRNLWAITFSDLFACDADTAKCKWVAKLPKEFNGLTFIPESLVPNSKQEALIGISESGDWNWIKPDGKGNATIQKLGKYGNGWLSSGDAFSVVGIGTFATLKKKSGGIDSLASIDPKTGKLLKVIGSTGVKGLYGFAWWADVFYGFAADGKIYVIDVKTGKASPAASIATPQGAKWWGAGVSTRANGP